MKRRSPQTDKLGYIGRLYLDNNYGRRVCQIYCDSRDWDTSCYPHDFFDSVLIDGNHEEDFVISDTRKAISVTKKGGLIMWHDFCPPVSNSFESTTGVLKAVYNNWEYINSNMEKIFWIQPSWILAGIKK